MSGEDFEPWVPSHITPVAPYPGPTTHAFDNDPSVFNNDLDGWSFDTVAQPAHQAGYLGTVTPPSIPYEQWRAGYDNACEEARRSAAAAAAAASAVASTPTSEVEKSIATYVQAAYGLSSRSAMSAAQKFFRDTQVAEKLRLACMGGR